MFFLIQTQFYLCWRAKERIRRAEISHPLAHDIHVIDEVGGVTNLWLSLVEWHQKGLPPTPTLDPDSLSVNVDILINPTFASCSP